VEADQKEISSLKDDHEDQLSEKDGNIEELEKANPNRTRASSEKKPHSHISIALPSFALTRVTSPSLG